MMDEAFEEMWAAAASSHRELPEVELEAYDDGADECATCGYVYQGTTPEGFFSSADNGHDNVCGFDD